MVSGALGAPGGVGTHEGSVWGVRGVLEAGRECMYSGPGGV